MSQLFPHGRWLLCRPDDYDVRYKINPWMDLQKVPVQGRAQHQWMTLHHTLLRLGAWVEYVQQGRGVPDMVFTANGGLVKGNTVVLPSFRFPERQAEETLFQSWFEKAGYTVVRLTTGAFEGEGDALFSGETLVGGFGFRTDKFVYQEIEQALDITPVVAVRLIDERFYHLDTCYTPLANGLAMAYREAFEPEGIVSLEKVSELIMVPEEDAVRFVCNSVVLGEDIVMPAGCVTTTAILERRGFRVHPVDLDEFLKAGGAAKCLSLRLDRV
jgi:N-dimethylarginine dimethylaminohydrolase